LGHRCRKSRDERSKAARKKIADREKAEYNTWLASLNPVQRFHHQKIKPTTDDVKDSVSSVWDDIWYKVKNMQFFSPNGIITTERTAGNNINLKGN
jgi:hypothetical protein